MVEPLETFADKRAAPRCSAAEGLRRLEDLIGQVARRIPHRAIGRAFDLVIHVAHTRAGGGCPR
jgi:Flp pilus assembly CpaF family ATPase